MYDPRKARLTQALQVIAASVTSMQKEVATKEAFLNNATRLAVVEELLVQARRQVIDAHYYLSLPTIARQEPALTQDEMDDLKRNAYHLECLVTAAQLANNDKE